MVYKSIDLQASMPRTLEMSHLAHQQQQKNVHEQTALGQQQAKADERQAQRSPKAESASGGTINERDQKERGNRQAGGNKRKPEEQNDPGAKQADHPYKGKHIDFTG